MSEMREFLMELYLKHGEGEFKTRLKDEQLINRSIRERFITTTPVIAVDHAGVCSYSSNVFIIGGSAFLSML